MVVCYSTHRKPIRQVTTKDAECILSRFQVSYTLVQGKSYFQRTTEDNKHIRDIQVHRDCSEVSEHSENYKTVTTVRGNKSGRNFLKKC
jgi:hypothetical protein